MNAKISEFVICAEAIIYLLLRNLHDCTFKQNSRFTSRKRDLSLNHAMHHFHVITPIMLLLHESRLKKKGQSHHHVKYHFHAITPIILLFYESRPEKMVNHAISPTAGGASIVKTTQ